MTRRLSEQLYYAIRTIDNKQMNGFEITANASVRHIFLRIQILFEWILNVSKLVSENQWAIGATKIFLGHFSFRSENRFHAIDCCLAKCFEFAQRFVQRAIWHLKSMNFVSNASSLHSQINQKSLWCDQPTQGYSMIALTAHRRE